MLNAELLDPTWTQFDGSRAFAQREFVNGTEWSIVMLTEAPGVFASRGLGIAMTLMATGIYGKEIPNQNGAPLRLVVPWKYGYKSIKSVVRISLVDKEPPTAWNKYSAREYGFYSNVNPEVDHPRWSQASERRIGGGLFARKQPTLMFNGYEEEVAGLYEGMDLVKFH